MGDDVCDLALHVLSSISGSHCPLLLLNQSCQRALPVHLINVREGLQQGRQVQHPCSGICAHVGMQQQTKRYITEAASSASGLRLYSTPVQVSDHSLHASWLLKSSNHIAEPLWRVVAVGPKDYEAAPDLLQMEVPNKLDSFLEAVTCDAVCHQAYLDFKG